jgi:hypothetical protein
VLLGISIVAFLIFGEGVLEIRLGFITTSRLRLGFIEYFSSYSSLEGIRLSSFYYYFFYLTY